MISGFLSGCATHRPAPVSGLNKDYGSLSRGSYRGSYYEVNKGDTPYFIAYVTDKDVSELVAYNDLDSSYTIYPGQKLKLWQPAYKPPVLGFNSKNATVAAAMEGHFLGVQSIAFSLVGMRCFSTAAKFAKHIVLRHIANPIPTNRLLNINIPDVTFEHLKGERVTRLGARHHSEAMIKQTDPRGQEIYWLGPPGKEQDAGEGTDFWAIEHGYVSITPLQVDLTAHESLTSVDNWLKEE